MKIDPNCKYRYVETENGDKLAVGDEFRAPGQAGWHLIRPSGNEFGDDPYYQIGSHPIPSFIYRRKIRETVAPKPDNDGWIPIAEFRSRLMHRKGEEHYFQAFADGRVTLGLSGNIPHSEAKYCKMITAPAPPRSEEQFAFEAEFEQFRHTVSDKDDLRHFWVKAIEFAKAHA